MVRPMPVLESTDPCVGLTALVDGVRRGDPAGLEALRGLLARGARLLLVRRLEKSQVEDCVEEVLRRVVRGIQTGELQDPRRLMSYVRIHLQCLAGERARTQAPPADAPAADSGQQILCRLLQELSVRERDSLTRFFVDGQDDGRICRECGIPPAQFRLLKQRVKARFSELAR